jgi:hypothetical protein
MMSDDEFLECEMNDGLEGFLNEGEDINDPAIQKLLQEALANTKDEDYSNQSQWLDLTVVGQHFSEDSAILNSTNASNTSTTKPPTGFLPPTDGRRGIQWVEMTKVLRDGTSAMAEGQMLFAPNFSLGDAMSATEMFDTKTDVALSGSLDVTWSQAWEEGRIPWPLKPIQWDVLLLECMSKMTCFLQGDLSVSSIFSCLYLHPEASRRLSQSSRGPEDVALLMEWSNVYFGLAKLVIDCVLESGVSCEEDFLAVCFGLDNGLFPSHAALLALMEEEKEKTSSVPSLQENKAYHFVRCLCKVLGTVTWKGNLNRRHWEEEIKHALEALEAWQQEVKDIREEDCSIVGFDAQIFVYLLNGHPVKKPTHCSWTEMFVFWREVLTSARQCLPVLDCTSYHSLLHFYEHFTQGSQSRPPSLLPRAILLTLTHQPRRAESLTFLGKETPRKFLASALSLLEEQSPDPVLWENVLEQMERQAMELLICRASNPARRRRRLANCLPGWIELENSVECLEATFCSPSHANENGPKDNDHPNGGGSGNSSGSGNNNNNSGGSSAGITDYPAGDYIADLVLLCAIEWVESGFLLNLFASSDFVYAYWYLEYLHNARIKLSERRQDYLRRHVTHKRKLKRMQSHMPCDLEMVEHKLSRLIFGAIYRILLVAARRKHWSMGGGVFDNPAIRLSHRFAPLARMIYPHFVGYSTFEKAMEGLNDTDNEDSALAVAAQHLKEVVQQCQRPSETASTVPPPLQVLLKLAQANLVTLMLLQKAHPSSLEVQTDFTLHPLIPRLVVQSARRNRSERS